MFAKPLFYRPLLALVAVLMTIAYIPMTALHWIAPGWEGLNQARSFAGHLARAACEPGHKKDNPYFLPGDAAFSWEPGENWSLGFAKRSLTDSPAVREGIQNGRYFIGGSSLKAKGIVDDMYARAVYLDDNTGRGGILYAVVDCFGLTNTDANAIRALAWGWAKSAGVRSIQVAATHTHAGIDTIGMSDFRTLDGKDPEFQRLLIEQTARAMEDAYRNRQAGKLYLAVADAGDLLTDLRDPVVINQEITRLRFSPDKSGEKDVYLVNAGCHPELTGPFSAVISADFPAYMAQYIMNTTGAETMFIQGAQGNMITVRDYRVVTDAWYHGGETGLGPTLLEPYGAEFAQYVLGEHENSRVSKEIELPALLNIASMEFEMPCENIINIAALLIGMFNHTCYHVHGKPYRYAITCELSYLRLGDEARSLDIMIQPGELAPEMAIGGFMDAEHSANGEEYPREALFDILRSYPFASSHKAVFGMANNFIGYIIPDNNYVLHPWLPYIASATDRFGHGHGDETSTLGPRAAGALTEAWARLLGGVEA